MCSQLPGEEGEYRFIFRPLLLVFLSEMAIDAFPHFPFHDLWQRKWSTRNCRPPGEDERGLWSGWPPAVTFRLYWSSQLGERWRSYVQDSGKGDRPFIGRKNGHFTLWLQAPTEEAATGPSASAITTMLTAIYFLWCPKISSQRVSKIEQQISFLLTVSKNKIRSDGFQLLFTDLAFKCRCLFCFTKLFADLCWWKNHTILWRICSRRDFLLRNGKGFTLFICSVVSRIILLGISLL